MEFYFAGLRPIYHDNLKYLGIFFAGCNFRCHYCYNKDLLEQKKEFLTDLSVTKKFISDNAAKGIVFCGGEPTMQKFALFSLARFSKDNGFKTILYTNGSKPDIIKAALREKLFDEYVISIKAPFDSTYQKVTNSQTYFLASNEIIASVRNTLSHFKENSNKDLLTVETTIVPNLIFRKEDIIKIAQEISDINVRWKLSMFVSGDCVDKRYSNLKPFSKTFMIALKDAVIKEYPILNMG